MRSNLSSAFLKLLSIQTGGAFPPFPATQNLQVLEHLVPVSPCPNASSCFHPQLLLTYCAHSQKNKELAFKIS